MIKYPYGTDDPYAKIELIASTSVENNKYTADDMPVMSARVSHGQDDKTGENPEADNKLARFLAKHKHMTPFEHQFATFRVVAPLFVFREWHRHRTQSYNEISMRYCSDPVGKFYKPMEWRKQATRNKQSSEGCLSETLSSVAYTYQKEAYDSSLEAYEKLIALGVCREQARTVIPVGNYSEMYASASLRNWFAFWILRSDKNAQWEIRQYSDAIAQILKEVWPNSWGALEDTYNEQR